MPLDKIMSRGATYLRISGQIFRETSILFSKKIKWLEAGTQQHLRGFTWLTGLLTSKKHSSLCEKELSEALSGQTRFSLS